MSRLRFIGIQICLSDLHLSIRQLTDRLVLVARAPIFDSKRRCRWRLASLMLALVLAPATDAALGKTPGQRFADSLNRPTYFISQETGRIRIIMLTGDDHLSPLSRQIRTVHITLYDPRDERIFIRLANRHHILRTAELCEAGNPYYYKLKNVYVKGYRYDRSLSYADAMIELGVSDWIAVRHA